METLDQQDQLRNKARAHFQFFVENAERFQLTLPDAQREAHIALQMVDYALSLAPGAPFPFVEWARTQGFGDGELRAMFKAMPALCGCLGLLDLYLEFPPLGKLPFGVGRTLIESETPVPYQGHLLTPDTVQVVYYRRALA